MQPIAKLCENSLQFTQYKQQNALLYLLWIALNTFVTIVNYNTFYSI